MKSKSPEQSKSRARTEKSLQEERISRKRSIRRMYEQYILLERENRNLMSEITNNENFLNFVLENSKNDANAFLASLEEMVNGDVKPRFGLEDPFVKKHIELIMARFRKEGYEVKFTGTVGSPSKRRPGTHAVLQLEVQPQHPLGHIPQVESVAQVRLFEPELSVDREKGRQEQGVRVDEKNQHRKRVYFEKYLQVQV